MNFTMSAAWRPFTTLAERSVSKLAPIPGRRQQRGAIGPADAAGHAEPRPTRRRDGQLSTGSQRPHQDAQGSRDRRRGVSPESPRRIRGDHAGSRRPGGDRSRPLRHLRRRTTAATPSPSSATTAARRSGSPSPSTGSSPTITSCKEELLSKGDYHLKRNTDTEIIMHSLAYELRRKTRSPTGSGCSAGSRSGSTGPTTSS